jgi:hypothetical protein
MSRRHADRNGAIAPPTPSPPHVAEPHRIDPNAVYLLHQAQHFLRLTRSTVRREVRAGRLRVARRAGRYYLLGRWLLEWLEAGEVPRRQLSTELGPSRS